MYVQSIDHEATTSSRWCSFMASTHPICIVMTIGSISNKPYLMVTKYCMCNDFGPVSNKPWAYGEFGLGIELAINNVSVWFDLRGSKPNRFKKLKHEPNRTPKPLNRSVKTFSNHFSFQARSKFKF